MGSTAPSDCVPSCPCLLPAMVGAAVSDERHAGARVSWVEAPAASGGGCAASGAAGGRRGSLLWFVWHRCAHACYMCGYTQPIQKWRWWQEKEPGAPHSG